VDTLQCVESLILLPTDKDNCSLNVNSESQHFIVVTNTGRYLPFVFYEHFVLMLFEYSYFILCVCLPGIYFSLNFLFAAVDRICILLGYYKQCSNSGIGQVLR